MNCEERSELLLLYGAGALERQEGEALRRHLEGGCPRCAGSLAEAEALLAHLPLALEPQSPRARVREQLLSRLEGEISRPSRALRNDWFKAAIAAGLAASVTYMLVALPAAQRGERMEEQFAQQISELQERLASQAAEIDRLQIVAERAGHTAQALGSRNLQLVMLDSAGPQPGAWGRILWDRDRGAWHLFAHGLKSAGPGKTYELWFITAAEEKIPAGTFDVDHLGRATMLVNLPPGIGRIAVAAVTDEPAGGSPQPTGAIQLVGSVSDTAA